MDDSGQPDLDLLNDYWVETDVGGFCWTPLRRTPSPPIFSLDLPQPQVERRHLRGVAYEEDAVRDCGMVPRAAFDRRDAREFLVTRGRRAHEHDLTVIRLDDEMPGGQEHSSSGSSATLRAPRPLRRTRGCRQ